MKSIAACAAAATREFNVQSVQATTNPVAVWLIVNGPIAKELGLNFTQGVMRVGAYGGATRVMPNYNVMGVAKAALEASVRYLAQELGPRGIRVNALSAGPVKTLAAKGITGFDTLIKITAKRSPMKRNITLDEVGNSGLYLCSDLSSAVTGETHHVDCGYHAIATCREDADIVVIADDTGNHILRDEAYWCEYNERYVQFEDNVEDRYSDDDDRDDIEDRPRSLMNYSFDVLQILSRDTSFESTSFGDFHMGVELELVTPESQYDAVEDLRSQLGMDYCVCKEDGSLPAGGIEVVTAPRKLTEHIDRFSKWQKIGRAYV